MCPFARAQRGARAITCHLCRAGIAPALTGSMPREAGKKHFLPVFIIRGQWSPQRRVAGDPVIGSGIDVGPLRSQVSTGGSETMHEHAIDHGRHTQQIQHGYHDQDRDRPSQNVNVRLP